MQRLTTHAFRYGLTTVIAAAGLMTATSASAQVGTAAKPLSVQGYPGTAFIGFGVTTQMNIATSVGGVTLFAAAAPNGPPLVRIPLPPPFSIDPDASLPDPWIFSGVPPGVYYVALVYGIVNAPTIAASDWTQLVVPGACTGAPGVGLIDRQSAGVEPNTVRLFISVFGGCASSYLVEAGTSPGASNVASFEQTGVLLSVPGVPAGNYYVRVRGKNQYGVGPYSEVFPVAVPGCSGTWSELASNLSATVVGNQLTLTWTPPVPAPTVGGPTTCYELARLGGPGPPSLRILLPASASSFSATVPSGAYLVGLFAGNNCTSDIVGGVTITVP